MWLETSLNTQIETKNTKKGDVFQDVMVFNFSLSQ